MSDCQHENFDFGVEVHRVTDPAGHPPNFVAELTVRCADCGKPFHFVGVPVGVSFQRPAASTDGTMLLAPIAPGEGPRALVMRVELPTPPEDAS